MQNIINFDNIISSKKVSVNLINELIGYAEDEKNIPAIRKAVAAVRGGKPFIMPDKNGNRDSGKWYKAFYAKMKDKNDELLRKAFLALRESGMTNHEIAEKTGSYRVSELIGATPKPLLIAHKEKLNAERKAKMLELRNQGLNNVQIAKRLGVSDGLVYTTLGKHTDEERKAIYMRNIANCHELRMKSHRFRGDGHWMHMAKNDRIRTLGSVVDKMRKADIPYSAITFVLGYSEATLRMYRRKYLTSVQHDS